MDSRTSSSTSVNAWTDQNGRRPVACSTRSAKDLSSVAWSPHSVWWISRISRVPSRCWETVSERIVSSVITPPALRMTWASPTSRPSIPNSGIRESMQATTATARAGRTGLLPGNCRAHSSFASSMRSTSDMPTSASPVRAGTLSGGCSMCNLLRLRVRIAADPTLTGSAADDDMVAGRDNDILLGNGGADVLIGGHGNDVLSIGDTTFRRVNGGTGHDVLAFSGAITLADAHFRKVSEVESLRLGNGAISLTMGAIAARAIDGLGNSTIAIDGTAHTSGPVTINASALLRPLSLTMGAANDSITILGGTVTVSGGGGIDTLAAAFSFTFGVDIENLTLLGAAAINGTGNALANRITGNAAGNILTGGLGNDFLDGGLVT